MKRILKVLSILFTTAVLPLTAQDPALIEPLARLLMAEDRRVLDTEVMAGTLEHPDPLVRRRAVLAVGRIGDPNGLPLLLQRLDDTDPLVVTETMFAIGLLGEAQGATMIIERLRRSDSLSTTALREAATALARIGGSAASAMIGDVIRAGGDLGIERREAMLSHALLDSWRLGSSAPLNDLLSYLDHEDPDLRWRAAIALGRIRSPAAVEELLLLLRDDVPVIREAAARALTARQVDSAGLERSAVIGELVRALEDQSAGVRINALGALVSYGDDIPASRLIFLLRDNDRNVRIATAAALGASGDDSTVVAMTEALHRGDVRWGERQALLAALAAIDSDAFATEVQPLLAATDPRDRMAAVQLWGAVDSAPTHIFSRALADSDWRVRQAALAAWNRSWPEGTSQLESAATAALNDVEYRVRAAAIATAIDTASEANLDRLGALWATNNFDIQEAVLARLIRFNRSDIGLLGRLTSPARRAILLRPADPRLRMQASGGFPRLAARWGGMGAVETGRTLADYREVVRVFLLAERNPIIEIETEGRSTITVELLARDAPLTVANMIRLVDRRYFDNSRWHRVVPNFVVQDGDPTGTGEGHPGWAIRDEINRHRYLQPMLGMALSGPNTGGSQWFINLSPQPHLDGTYTIFGRVTGSFSGLVRVLQGDVIRTIRRVGGP